MGVDSSYGSGAPLSAAASAARRRTAASSRLRANSASLRRRNNNVLARRNAAAAPSTVRDKYNPQLVNAIGSFVDRNLGGTPMYINGIRVQESGVSPWKAVAMYAARIARAIPEASNLSTIASVARRAPRSTAGIRAQYATARASAAEVESLVEDLVSQRPMGYSSRMFPDHVSPLFRPGEISSVYRAAAKIAGREAARTGDADFRIAGRFLRDVSKKGYR